MKKARLTEEQIIGLLREHEAGAATGDLWPQARDQQRDALQLEGQVWRARGLGGQAAAVAGG